MHLLDLSGPCPTPQSLLVARPELRTQLWRGILCFEWAENAQFCNLERMLVISESALIVVDVEPRLKSISYSIVHNSPTRSPHISPSGLHIAFVHKNDLNLIMLNDDIYKCVEAKPVRVTRHGSTVGWKCGEAEYVAEEEMNRKDGYWWSSDGSKILFSIVDESKIPEFQVNERVSRILCPNRNLSDQLIACVRYDNSMVFVSLSLAGATHGFVWLCCTSAT